MLRKKILALLVIVSMLATGFPVTVAANAVEPPAENPSVVISIPPTGITLNSAIVNVTISAGTGNTITQAILYLSPNTADFSTSNDLRVISSNGISTEPFSSLESNHRYFVGVAIDFTYIDSNNNPQTGRILSEPREFTTLPPATLPTLGATTHSDLTRNSAVISINVTNEGSTSITRRGAVFTTPDTDPVVDASNSTTVNASSNSASSVTLTGLTPNTTYRVRAFAQNSAGIAYGAVATFTTPVTSAPVLNATTTTNITHNSAVININLNNNGGANITQVGAVYSTSNSNPMIGGSNVTRTNASSASATTVSITGLTANTTYHVRAFATNTQGTNYGTVTTFTTTSTGQIPTVSTGAVTSIERNRANVRINVTNQGATNVTERGVVFSTSSTRPDVTNSTKRTVTASGTGQSTVSLTGLAQNTRYYVWAYAINSHGTAFGERAEFRTLNTTGSGSTPDAVTIRSQEVNANTAEIQINISGTAITERGVVYSSHNELPERTGSRNHRQTIFGTTGEVTVMLQDLSRDTKYYARAYAVNSHGTSYGDVIEFTTRSSDVIPHVVTVSATGTSNEAIEVRIDVKRDNGSNITERGVVYSRTNNDPKLGDRNSDEEETSGRTGAATVTLTRLSRNETYYVRAYATNREGTAYGAVLEVRLGGNNNVVTNKVTNITGTTATAGGTTYFGSNSDIREVGVVYSSERRLPTNTDTIVRANTSDYGTFSVNLTGLTPNRTYYVRAYARNNSGNYEYGGVEEFTTIGNATLSIQYRLPDGSQVGAQSLTFAPGRVIRREDLTPPSGFNLLHPEQTYTMPSANDTITVYVRRGGVYQVMQPTRSAGTQLIAGSSGNTLMLNGQATNFPAVNIDDYNWLKLRDIAMLLRGTNKQFQVGFDPVRNTGSINSGMQYTPVGGELHNTLSPHQIAVATPQRLIMDGNEISIAAYNIDGFNYFRLRDIAILLDFGLGFDSASGVITLQLDRPYSE